MSRQLWQEVAGRSTCGLTRLVPCTSGRKEITIQQALNTTSMLLSRTLELILP